MSPRSPHSSWGWSGRCKRRCTATAQKGTLQRRTFPPGSSGPPHRQRRSRRSSQGQRAYRRRRRCTGTAPPRSSRSRRPRSDRSGRTHRAGCSRRSAAHCSRGWRRGPHSRARAPCSSACSVPPDRPVRRGMPRRRSRSSSDRLTGWRRRRCRLGQARCSYQDRSGPVTTAGPGPGSTRHRPTDRRGRCLEPASGLASFSLRLTVACLPPSAPTGQNIPSARRRASPRPRRCPSPRYRSGRAGGRRTLDPDRRWPGRRARAGESWRISSASGGQAVAFGGARGAVVRFAGSGHGLAPYMRQRAVPISNSSAREQRSAKSPLNRRARPA